MAEQIAQWVARKEEADIELETWPARGRRRKAELLAAQLEEQASSCLTWKTPARAQTRASEQRASVTRCSSNWVLAAEQRSLDEQSRQLDTRYERLRADRNAWPRPTRRRLNNLRKLKPPKNRRNHRSPPGRAARHRAPAGRRPPRPASRT